jgi:hypothetical protein
MCVNTPAIACTVLIACCTSSIASADRATKEIPLDRIWALKMRGTRDVRNLSQDDAGDIRRALTRAAGERAKAGPCFVVYGTGKEALGQAAKVLVTGAEPAKVISAGREASLVFYTYSAPGYVVLHSVRRSDRQLIIRYQVIIHQTSNASVHFAIIPLGKLVAGELAVKVIEVPSETPYTNHKLTDQAVCDPCTIIAKEGA